MLNRHNAQCNSRISAQTSNILNAGEEAPSGISYTQYVKANITNADEPASYERDSMSYAWEGKASAAPQGWV
eukprot:6197822-Pleurochrysis_carterae.AAC.2